MASSTINDQQEDYIILQGQNNFFEWKRQLQQIGRSKNIWDILRGNEPAISEPKLYEYIPELVDTPGKKSKGEAPPQEHKMLDLFNNRCSLYELSQKRIILAMNVLRNSVSEAIKHELDSFKDSYEAVQYLEKRCRMTKADGLYFALEKLQNLRLEDSEKGNDYLR